MRINYFAALLAIAACKDATPKQQTPVTTAGSGSAGSATGSADPWAGKPATPDTPELRKKRADAALSRVAEIMPKLAKVRELTFEHDIPREYQSSADFKTFVHAEIQKEMPADKAADESAALFQIGLLTKPGNLAELEEQAFTTQAGAYYDPKKKKFFLVMVPDNDTMLDTISAHELTHGLQDQHFDLQKFMPDNDKKLDDDHQAARRFVAEGDATLTMFLYAVATMTNKPITPDVIKLMSTQLDAFAKMSPEEMVKQNAAGFGGSMDPEIKKSIDAMADIPLTVLVPMIDSYTQGAGLAATAFLQTGSWAGVNALFTDPPESTEQALHPATKMYPKRDHPKPVSISTATDKPENKIADVVLGELQWQVYFQLWLPAQRAIASEGWGGDRVTVIKRGDGRLVARIATVWDTEKDATEFAQAYATSLKPRFMKGTGDPKTGFDRGDGAGRIYMKQVGANVYIVDGADDAAWLDDLIKATTI